MAAETGTISAAVPANSATATSCAATRSLETLSVLVTTTTSVVLGATERICSTIHRSPGPIASSAGTHSPMTSTSE
ncbi:Uncharacterised protein [Mycobacterium tuberculosis]|nr:Uncharacterised protein [Mycobacterium tuberculosis]